MSTETVEDFVKRQRQNDVLYDDPYLRRLSVKLEQSGVLYVDDLVKLTPKDILRMTGTGARNIARVQHALSQYNLSLS